MTSDDLWRDTIRLLTESARGTTLAHAYLDQAQTDSQEAAERLELPTAWSQRENAGRGGKVRVATAAENSGN